MYLLRKRAASNDVTASQRKSLEANFTRQKAFERWDRLFEALK